MRTLEEIDTNLPLDIGPFQCDLDRAYFSGVDGLESISLAGADVRLFLDWAKSTRWREVIESDLQSLAMDSLKRNLLTAFMPLVTFRNEFCGGGRPMQDEATQALMERLRMATRSWREAGCDLVDISGRIVVEAVKNTDGSIEDQAQLIAEYVLQEEVDLSEWQVEFLAVALFECAQHYGDVISAKDCINELLQMNSQHRGSVTGVVHAMTGLAFTCTWRRDGERTLFKPSKVVRSDRMAQELFDALEEQHGWGSDAHRTALRADALMA